MGKRCHWAALGATFALLVAACAATEAPRTPRASGTTTERAQPEAVRFPTSAADATFVQAEPAGGDCAAGDRSRVALFDPAGGEELWTLDIPRPGGQTVVSGDVVYVSFGWDRDQPPGVGAIDLDLRAPLWQRFFEEPPEQLVTVGDSLVVVSRSGVRALDLESGDDRWTIGSEFDFTEVTVDGDSAYALTNVAVHGIDLRSGEVVWELPIERPDELAAQGRLLAVAADNLVIAVDTAARTRLWEKAVNRLGAGDMWVSSDSVIIELAPSESPSGGLVALDSESGLERWRVASVDDVHWPTPEQLVTTIASPAFRGALRYDLVALDANTGDQLWAVPTTESAGEIVLDASPGRVLINEPHPAVAGVDRLRLVNGVDGSIVWDVPILEPLDGARIEGGVFVSLYRTVETLLSDRGHVELMIGPSRSWTATLPDGVRQDMRLTPHGALVVSGELSATCVGRSLQEPAPAGSSDVGEEVELSTAAP